METNDLVARLAVDAAPVRRLPSPAVRVVIWLAISAPVVLAVMVLMSSGVPLLLVLFDRQFLIEETAILATALTAAFAAFWSVIPGAERKFLLLPLVPLAVWLTSLGEGCVRDWFSVGVDGLQLRLDGDCVVPAALMAIIPTAAMLVMLRRGAPLVPRATLALGVLAVAALGNFGLRLFHLGDVSVMVLFWHFGSVLLLSLIAASLGRSVLHWRHRVRLART